MFAAARSACGDAIPGSVAEAASDDPQLRNADPGSELMRRRRLLLLPRQGCGQGEEGVEAREASRRWWWWWWPQQWAANHTPTQALLLPRASECGGQRGSAALHDVAWRRRILEVAGQAGGEHVGGHVMPRVPACRDSCVERVAIAPAWYEIGVARGACVRGAW